MVVPFDPIASPMVIPSPNDMVVDPMTGLVNEPIDPNASAAQQEFTRDYLNTLNGSPTSVTASTKLVDLDKSTVSVSSVRFIDLLQGTPIVKPPVTPAVAYDESTASSPSHRRPRAGPGAAGTPWRSSRVGLA